MGTPSKDNLAYIPLKSNIAYVRTEVGVFYVNKNKQECNQIPLDQNQLKEFDSYLQPKKVSKSLTIDQLNKITHMTGHSIAKDGCDLIRTASIPDKNNLKDLPIRSYSAYVRSQDKLFYVDKIKKECREIKIDNKQRQEFDKQLKSTDTAITLSQEKLTIAQSITKHQRDTKKADVWVYGLSVVV